jgi:molybdopterin molybdotransferase
MLSLDEARSRILKAVSPLEAEPVPVSQAMDRFLAEDVSTAIDLPPFDNSAMDGYAVRAEEVRTATAEKPVFLKIAGRVAAGERFEGTVQPGTCVRVFTGSPLPKGADAVVMQEDCRAEGADSLSVMEGVRPLENVRLRGEDIKRGSTIGSRGQRIGPGLAGLLAAAGMKEIKAGRPPRIALLATGSELAEPGATLQAGQIYESNRVTLAALIRRAGGIPHPLPLVADDLTATQKRLAEAFEYDAVITSGGVSVGAFDFVKEAFTNLGGSLEFWKVAIKPGKPFVFGQWKRKFLFGLPGNPVSAAVTFLLLVRPAILGWQGAAEIDLPRQRGVVLEPIRNPGDRAHFMRVRIELDGSVRLAGPQASHVISGLAAANGLLEVAPGTTLGPGQSVEVMRLE